MVFQEALEKAQGKYRPRNKKTGGLPARKVCGCGSFATTIFQGEPLCAPCVFSYNLRKKV